MGRENKKTERPSPNDSPLSLSQLYEAVLTGLPIGFSRVDQDGLILEFNPAAERLTGYSREEVLGKSHLAILHGSSDPKACPLFSQVFQYHTASIVNEAILKRKNGETITLTGVAFPLFDNERNFIGGAELFRDITDQKRLERERKNLLSMFAHDMKNPVVAGQGFLTRLLSEKAGPLTAKQRDYLTIIRETMARLQRLISDFLDFSRYEAKEYAPLLGPYNIKEALNRQIELTQTEADKKDQTIRFESTSESLPIIEADAVMIDRVLANLLDNAVKYTNPGGKVTAKLTRREKDIMVEVTDTGIGIHEQDLPCLFDAFCRIDRTVEGSGLGLSIAKAIVEAHGGTISVESIPGQGSTFRFILPIHIPRP